METNTDSKECLNGTPSTDSIVTDQLGVRNWLDCGASDSFGCLRSDKKEDPIKSVDPTPLKESDLSSPSRDIWIVTTAALPWRTGTAVNPFLRALYLVKRRLAYAQSKTGDKGSDSTDLKVGKVTLVIPWLESASDREKVYGSHEFTQGEKGQLQQLEWIKNYASENCGLSDEVNCLNFLFYNASYWESFGSIFPTVDICRLIPDNEADVAVLEEPEHLNWFRIPSNDSNIPTSPTTKTGPKNDTNNNDREQCKSPLGFDDDEGNQEDLGWAHKFTYVVGIIHTNYAAYMKQYGIGTSLVAAPAVSAMSSIVVRAYCHKVINLSGVIPSYAKWKEVTCNVHGVREDFLKQSTEKDSANKDGDYAPIYFIGKLLWAKGFDKMLKVQELFKKSSDDKDYFPIDVYGSGPDEKAISRAFHGRLFSGDLSVDRSEDQVLEEENDLLGSFSDDDLFSDSKSLREQLQDLVKKQEDENTSQPYNDARNYINMGFEIVTANSDLVEDESLNDVAYVVQERDSTSKADKQTDPISIIGDVSEKSLLTGIKTTQAVKNMADSAIKAGMALAFSEERQKAKEETNDAGKSYVFDPPKSRFEWRRNPIPARFLGVKDHALLRNMPYKIFLNTSVTEVLCTTTAEALAMGKFVIIPKHPSNDFFLQFPNCLAYTSLNECVEKVRWALENEPTPLSEEHAYIFTWEAATDRLIQSSIVTDKDAMKRSEAGRDKADSRMAWLHSEGGKKGRLIRTLFSKLDNSDKSSKTEEREE